MSLGGVVQLLSQTMQTFLGWSGLALGVLSIVASAYFAIRYSERKDPRFFISSSEKIVVADDTRSDLKVFFRDKPVPTLTLTTVAFWNAGRRPILHGDIAPRQPLRIALSGARPAEEILEVAIKRSSRDSIGFTATIENPTSVRLDFDFLDRNDGAVVDILHTAPGDAGVNLEGVILGAPSGLKVVSASYEPASFARFAMFGVRSRLPRSRRATLRRFVIGAIGTALFFAGIYLFTGLEHEITTTRERLVTSLAPFVDSIALPRAVAAVDAKGKYRLINALGPYVAVGFTALLVLGQIAFLIGGQGGLPPSLSTASPTDGRPSERDAA